jgi:hypothetical protein
MAKRQRQWTVQRQLVPTSGSWHRWDRAYQLLVHWTTEQQEYHPQEEPDANSNVCPSLDHPASPDAND